jgi:hypothetical protein
MAYDSSLVVYNSVPLTTINVTPGMDLQTALQNINIAVATTINPNYALFNYGPYSGFTIQNTSGGPITTLQQFVEGISKTVCVVQDNLYTFTGTTYPANQVILSNAITALQVPGITYSNSAGGLTISIGNTDPINTVLTKLATGLGNTGNILAAPGNAWSLLLITQPTTISAAFNNLINYNLTQDTAIAGKEASIGTFNNSINCLSTIGGTSTDDAGETIDLLTQYTCALDKFDAAPINLTVTCLTPQADLQDWIAYIVSTLESNATTTYVAVDSSMTVTSLGACSGNRIGVNPAWTVLRNVAASAQDTTPGDLTDKLAAGTNVSFTTLNPGANEQIEISVPLPTLNKVAVNSLDATPDYLAAKITPAYGNWGLSTSVLTSTNNDQLVISTVVTDPFTLAQNLINYISTDPVLLAAFCALKTQCDGCQCLAATAFTVTADLINTEFGLSWAAGTSLGETQTVTYREQGATAWISSANINAPNPQAYTTTSAVVENLNTNNVYEFQIVSNCGTGPNYSAIVTGIIYSQQTLTVGVNTGVISVNQASMPTVDIIEYTLVNSVLTPIETVSATGTNPVGVFTAQASGTYYVQYRYGTLINGVTLYSDDPSQAGTFYQSSGIVIP